MIVTFFTHYSARSKTEEDITLEVLCERVKSTRAEYKDQLPWLKAAKFGNLATEKGSLRHDANVVEVWGVEADKSSPSEMMPTACRKPHVSSATERGASSPRTRRS
jgi:hypothetical protein